jgi:ComF family protein
MLTELIRRIPWLEGMIDFAFPPLCLGCGEYCEDQSQICERCLRRIQALEQAICLSCETSIGENVTCPQCHQEGLVLYSYGQYHDPLTEVILQLKFKGITSPARTLGQLLVELHRRALEKLSIDYLIPVPLHPSRENRRGYNQALLLARSIGELLEVAVADDLMWRTRRRYPQSRLSMSHRVANIRGVFEIADDIPPGRYVIVDDVVTSGSTVREVARLLKASGVEVAGVISLAYGGQPR